MLSIDRSVPLFLFCLFSCCCWCCVVFCGNFQIFIQFCLMNSHMYILSQIKLWVPFVSVCFARAKNVGSSINRKREVFVMISYSKCVHVAADRRWFFCYNLALLPMRRLLLLLFELNRSLLNSFLLFYVGMHNTLYHMCAFVGKIYSSIMNVGRM